MFEGRDLVPLSDHEMESIRGNEISMIFQEPMTSLNPVYSVGEQIAEAVRIHKGASKREAMDRARASGSTNPGCICSRPALRWLAARRRSNPPARSPNRSVPRRHVGR